MSCAALDAEQQHHPYLSTHSTSLVINCLNTRCVCSYKAAGDSALLQALGNAHGIQVNIVNLVEDGQGGVMGQVSSSKIRSALNQGRMPQVAQSLGRPYRLVADLSHHLLRPDCTGVRSIRCAFVKHLPCSASCDQGNQQCCFAWLQAANQLSSESAPYV